MGDHEVSTMTIARAARAAALMLVVSVAIAGCGNDSDEDSRSQATAASQTAEPPSALARCLERGGARLATNVDDLNFYFDAQESTELSSGGFARDREIGARIDISWGIQRDGRPPEWFVWAAQPQGDQTLDTRQLVEDTPARSYVAYIQDATPAQRRKLARCIRFEPLVQDKPPASATYERVPTAADQR